MINAVNIFGGQCWTHYPRCPTVTKARYCCSTAALQEAWCSDYSGGGTLHIWISVACLSSGKFAFSVQTDHRGKSFNCVTKQMPRLAHISHLSRVPQLKYQCTSTWMFTMQYSERGHTGSCPDFRSRDNVSKSIYYLCLIVDAFYKKKALHWHCTGRCMYMYIMSKLGNSTSPVGAVSGLVTGEEEWAAAAGLRGKT